jgi:peptide/nickel transport system permease protein
MASETPTDPERFEDIDWTAVTENRRRIPRRTAAFLVAIAVYAIVLAYDRFILGDEPTFAFESVGFVWNVTRLDWLFILTLVMMVFYLVVPLATNRRMSRYYWQQFKKNKAAVVSAIYLLVIFMIGMIGPLFMAPPQLNFGAVGQPPVGFSISQTAVPGCIGEVVSGQCTGTWAHPLGTTTDGKGILKLVIFGMRVSMQVGLIATFIAVIIGTAVGTTAAYSGGLTDEILMRYVDIQLTFPAFFLYLLLLYLFGGSLFLMILLFGFFSWGGISRLVRSEALQRREETYIQAADSAGAGRLHIIKRHIVPNVSNTIITAATLLIPVLILAEASLSFLGLGDATVYSWGQVIATGRSNLTTAWWISTIPGIFLFFTILAFNFLGDALRDALDPRQESS